MENINEETPKRFINDLNKATQRTNPNVQAYNRYNRAKNELANESGGDFRIGIRGCKNLRTINDLSHWYISSIYTGWGTLVNLEE